MRISYQGPKLQPIDATSFKLSVGDRNIQASCYKADTSCRKMSAPHLILSLCHQMGHYNVKKHALNSAQKRHRKTLSLLFPQDIQNSAMFKH